MIEAILFDLDETLILDEPLVRHAFLMTARSATPDLEAARKLAHAAEAQAKRLWQELPARALEYANRIGHSAFEGLWATYDGRIEAEAALEAAMLEVRARVWQEALAECGLTGDAHTLQARWADLRSRTVVYPDADETLLALKRRFKLGVVTNGVAGLQRRKWHTSGLEHWFDAIAISGELGVGKPNPEIFAHAAGQLKVPLESCVMVGDNAERDVQGGINAGLKTVFVDRGFKPRGAKADLDCRELADILPWLRTLGFEV